jgi:hypothetical protein
MRSLQHRRDRSKVVRRDRLPRGVGIRDGSEIDHSVHTRDVFRHRLDRPRVYPPDSRPSLQVDCANLEARAQAISQQRSDQACRAGDQYLHAKASASR